MQVYLIMRRTDIPDGVLQVVDLWPNTSNKNSIYPPGLGQTGYIHNIQSPLITGSVGGGPTFTVSADITGVAAYLIGNIDTGAAPGGAPFTGAQADTAAAGIVALAQSGPAGSPITLVAVNAVLGGVVAGTTLTGGGSTGVLTELLAALAGNIWRIPAGTNLAAAGVKVAAQQGAFVEGTYKQLYDTGHFLCSNLNGNISRMKATSFTYDEVMSAAVTVYAADGTLFV